MHILIEGQSYLISGSKTLEEIRKDFPQGRGDEWHVSVKVENGYITFYTIGYYFSPRLKDGVFFLPKVILDKTPSGICSDTLVDCLAPGSCTNLKDEKFEKFLREFSLWIFKALKVFYRNNPESEVVHVKTLPRLSQRNEQGVNTLLDVIQELIRFCHEHQDYLKLVTLLSHSENGKVDWGRTVSHSQPLFIDGKPVYVNPITKRKSVNFDEELMVIYYSVLNYLKGLNFPVTEIPFGYELITGRKFQKYIDNGGRHLNAIKYKYFSDIDLTLWNLCYAFFQMEHDLRKSPEIPEMVISTKFSEVYEAMMDRIIGSRDEEIQRMRVLDDGKVIDHLFKYRDVLKPDDIIEKEQESNKNAGEVFYIGDSKYYGIGNEVSGVAKSKQYTYAKGIIQQNIGNTLNDSGNSDNALSSFRDSITEGYNIIPNFFIRAKIDESYSFDALDFTEYIKNDGQYLSRQFNNRLFDRDTLMLFTVEINLLFVLKLYGRDKDSLISSTQEQIYSKVRKIAREKLEEKFTFYALVPKPGIDAGVYFRQNLYNFLGKIYAPYHFSSTDDRTIRVDNEEYPVKCYNSIFSLALEKNKDNPLLNSLKEDFVVEECNLGKDPLEIDKIRECFSPNSGKGFSLIWASINDSNEGPNPKIIEIIAPEEDYKRWFLPKIDLFMKLTKNIEGDYDICYFSGTITNNRFNSCTYNLQEIDNLTGFRTKLSSESKDDTVIKMIGIELAGGYLLTLNSLEKLGIYNPNEMDGQ